MNKQLNGLIMSEWSILLKHYVPIAVKITMN